MRIQQDQRFEEEFAALPEHIQTRARKRLALFLENPRHPSLRTKKMQGHQDIWEGRITRDYRFTFEFIGDIYRLRRIGTHSILDHP